ncbi:hypothetical protein [Aquabacterium sp.]|uniref:hypothetical protein n=1 Tax=Aquabacterium sp. TaxID=1872578 RepID=UPI0019A37048|nr:hypothetical protein [Aquabacterium sp.]MBC7701274.1 hypothetical protein [Aquabacterium sp.]
MKFTQLALATALTTSLLALPLSASAQSKKELVQKLMVTQQPLIDNAAQNLAEQPARQLVGGAKQVLSQAVPPEKREATAKQVDVEIKKYLDGAVPLFRASANKLSASSVAPALEEKFSEDELKQLITILESPVLKKYQAALPDLIGSSFLEKVVLDVRPQLDPKLQSAQNNLRAILDTASGGKLSGQAPAAAPAKAATKPAPKPAASK